MFTYSELEKACKRLDIYPFKRGESIYGNMSPIMAVSSKPFDLESINFPSDILEEVLGIGRLINNLYSQKNTVSIFSAQKAYKNYKAQNQIKTALSILELSQEFWFKRGLEKTSFKETEFTICCGLIFREDFDKKEIAEELHANMVKVIKEKNHALARSAQAMNNIPLS